jgi:hypothetical protein
MDEHSYAVVNIPNHASAVSDLFTLLEETSST